MSVERRRERIEPSHPALFIGPQCRLLAVSRSAFYYAPVGESPFNLAQTRWIGFYNTGRPHSSLAGRTPDEAYHRIAPTPSPGHAPKTVSVIPMAA